MRLLGLVVVLDFVVALHAVVVLDAVVDDLVVTLGFG